MHQGILVDKTIEDGRRLIEALDKAGLQPRAALWYHGETERWRLAISMPLVERAGHLKAYEKIAKVMKKLAPPLSFDLSDISVQTTRASELIWAVKSTVGSNKVEGFRYIPETAYHSSLGDAYVYRI